MNVHPIFAALRKHKAGVFLIGLQIALTLAIVCNVVFIVAQREARMHRPTGLDEKDLFLVTQQYTGAPDASDPASLEKLDSMQLTDLAALRAAPDVQAATPVNSLPLLNDNWVQEVFTKKPGRPRTRRRANIYYGGKQMFQTLGLRLIAGRDFTSNDVRHRATRGKIDPPLVIVTKALADTLFPNGDALGKPIYISSNRDPSIIVGEVARMMTSAANGWDSIAWDSVLIPARNDGSTTMYAVRAKAGRMHAAMEEARKALYAANPMRVIQQRGHFDQGGIQSFFDLRQLGYALDIFMVQVFTAICVILLVITGVGMTGLTSFWVNQRHKQIGIRRALGARKMDIMRYFQMENLLIAGGGCIVGVALAIGLNLALLRLFAMQRMPVWYVLIGVVVVLLLGQIAVFAPARRASNVPPVVATRSV